MITSSTARGATLAGLSALVLALTGCSATPAAAPSAPPATGAQTGSSSAGDDLLAGHGLSGTSGQQVVESLDRNPGARPLSLRGSVRPDQVVLDDGVRQATLPLPKDSFYLSIAPYENRTHECFHHNLGTCQGELANEQVHVKITDSAGKAVVDQQATTYANGFVGFWVPRGSSGTVTITRGDKTGQTPFSTGADSPTCLTTLRLT